MHFKKLKSRILSFGLGILTVFPLLGNCTYALPNTSKTVVSENSQANQSIHGFLLNKTLDINNHHVMEYQHEKSGAWFVIEKNNNPNKCFEISVRTPPENDKGINHIIEHCVLNGSKDFPCKNMIWELRQNSFNTFLNAQTWPLYTTYPVASLDEEELTSLAKIYTSGVLKPSFLNDERIFKKEGIRFELDKTGALNANGTVFNEMQQSFNEQPNIMLKTLFPDTQGKNLSGGIPKDITELSYKEVCETYKKYYHPSNMVITLKGDADYEKFMKWLNEDYLQNYEKQNTENIKYTSQAPSKLPEYKTFDCYVPSSSDQLFTGVVSYILDFSTYNKYLSELDDIKSILNNPTSPRNIYLQSKGYKTEFAFYDTLYDPLFQIYFSSKDKESISQKNIEETLKEVFEKYPITQKEIDTICNNDKFERQLSEASSSYEKYISTNDYMQSFIRFNQPCSEKYFKDYSTESKKEKNYNDIINKILNNKKTIIAFIPCSNIQLSHSEILKDKIKSLESQKDILTQNHEEQKKWSESPNSPKNLDTIKKMFKKLSDIKVPSLECPLQNKKLNGKPYYYSAQDIKDFISYKFVFKVNHLCEDDKMYLPLFNEALKLMNTKNHSRTDLEALKSQKCITNYSFNVCENNKKEKNAYAIIDITCQENDLDKSLALANEEFNNIDFNDKTNLKNIISSIEESLTSCNTPAAKFGSCAGKLLNLLFSYMYEDLGNSKNFIKEISAKIDDKNFLKELSQNLENIKNKIINYNSLVGIGICSSEKNKSLAESKLEKFISNFSSLRVNPNTKIKLYEVSDKNIDFLEPSCSNGTIICSMNSKELSKDAGFNVTCQILNNKFFAPQIREKLGAYHCEIIPVPEKNKIVFVSTSNPNLKGTIDIVKTIPQFIEKLEISDDDITNISKSLLNQNLQNDKLSLYHNQSESTICKNLDYCNYLNECTEIIKNMNSKKIKKHGKLIKKALKTMKIYALTGNLNEEEEKLFDEIIK